MIKRLIDMSLSLACLIVSAPLMMGIAIAILLTEGRPVLYRGKRVGRNGKPFDMIKFRSMIANADQLGSGAIPNADPRITRLGTTLRKTKLDELPQFFNVLAGEMSLVGPRPELWRYAESFTPEDRKVLQVRPGLTDWATLVNMDEGVLLHGSPDPDAEYDKFIRPLKVTLQLEYIRCATLWTDFELLFYTATKLLFRGWVPPKLRPYRESLMRAMAIGRDEQTKAVDCTS